MEPTTPLQAVVFIHGFPMDHEVTSPNGPGQPPVPEAEVIPPKFYRPTEIVKLQDGQIVRTPIDGTVKARNWRFLSEKLSFFHRIMLSYNATATVQDTANELANILTNILETLHIQPQDVGVIAHSMGGLVCAALSRLNNKVPFDFRFAVLLDTPTDGLNLELIEQYDARLSSAVRNLTINPLSWWEAGELAAYSTAVKGLWLAMQKAEHGPRRAFFATLLNTEELARMRETLNKMKATNFIFQGELAFVRSTINDVEAIIVDDKDGADSIFIHLWLHAIMTDDPGVCKRIAALVSERAHVDGLRLEAMPAFGAVAGPEAEELAEDTDVDTHAGVAFALAALASAVRVVPAAQEVEAEEELGQEEKQDAEEEKEDLRASTRGSRAGSQRTNTDAEDNDS